MEPSSAPWRVLDASEPDQPAGGPVPGGVRWPVVAAIIVAVAVAAAAFLLAMRSDPVVGIDGATGAVGGSGEPSPQSADQAPAAGPELVVEVGGAVARPGVYRLAPGSRVGDAVAVAGGFGPRVDAAAADRLLNLAAVLRDGDEVHVPSRDEAAASSTGAGGVGEVQAGRIDVNRASAEELDTLPGIGPATAAKIIAARAERPFASVDDLRARKVVGEATLEKLRDLVMVGP